MRADITALDTLFCHYVTDKGSLGHYYTPVYEEIFRPIQHKPISILEIGVHTGSSLETFRDFFTHEKTRIVGVDIDLGQIKSSVLNVDQIKLIKGDINSQETMALVCTEGPYDLIIDDGSHFSWDVIRAFESLFYTQLKSGGVYVVEDLETNYMTKKTNPMSKLLFKLLRKHNRIRNLDVDGFLFKTWGIRSQINIHLKHQKHEMLNYFKHLIDAINLHGKNLVGRSNIEKFHHETPIKSQRHIEWIKFARQQLVAKKR